MVDTIYISREDYMEASWVTSPFAFKLLLRFAFDGAGKHEYVRTELAKELHASCDEIASSIALLWISGEIEMTTSYRKDIDDVVSTISLNQKTIRFKL